MRLLIFLVVCIIRCQSANDTVTAHSPILPIPSSLTGSYSDTSASSSFGGPSEYGGTRSGNNNNNVPPVKPSVTRSRSRVIDTKYGKVQGLSVNLFENANQQYQGRNNPLKNRIVEVSEFLCGFLVCQIIIGITCFFVPCGFENWRLWTLVRVVGW